MAFAYGKTLGQVGLEAYRQAQSKGMGNDETWAHVADTIDEEACRRRLRELIARMEAAQAKRGGK